MWSTSLECGVRRGSPPEAKAFGCCCGAGRLPAAARFLSPVRLFTCLREVMLPAANVCLSRAPCPRSRGRVCSTAQRGSMLLLSAGPEPPTYVPGALCPACSRGAHTPCPLQRRAAPASAAWPHSCASCRWCCSGWRGRLRRCRCVGFYRSPGILLWTGKNGGVHFLSSHLGLQEAVPRPGPAPLYLVPALCFQLGAAAWPWSGTGELVQPGGVFG